MLGHIYGIKRTLTHPPAARFNCLSSNAVTAMLLWPPGHNEKATKCHFVHKQQMLAVSNQEELAGGIHELSDTIQELVWDIEENTPLQMQ